ncbi:winged helix-turn-helix domain-containing protein [Labrys okinawensis]|uniref:winged helix-turn-helix domain-containing protein n=1 Tax=Labrys okinawensis TaxID=346911 RepID=UPI0039BC54C7
MPRKPRFLTKAQARRVLLHAQRLDSLAPFGDGVEATPAAVAHLGYVQIDTINVIERSHHHILWTRIPGYKRAHLTQAQSSDRSVFEYWTHALSYIPTTDLRFFLPDMKRYHERQDKWFDGVTKADMRKVLTLIRKDGPLTIRDIDDDVLMEKDHPWASRKPSKRALQLAFYTGVLAVSAREGMLKTYELMGRHFGWDGDPALKPKPATERQGLDYLIDRALRSQGIVTLDSICHLVPSLKGAVRERIEARMRRREILAVDVEEAGKVEHWARPEALEAVSAPPAELVHILSPFDPLVIQRKRLKFFFDYDHRFEAYVPKEKRVLGYFALPVLAGEEVVAAIDLKTDRAGRKLLIQQWSWVGQGEEARHKAVIEEALGRFETFQLE